MGADTAPLSDQGIISAAIASAAALPATPSKGQENVSLLEQQSARKTSSAKTQFTFTCESEAAKGMIWSSQNSPLPSTPYQTVAPTTATPVQPIQNHRGFATQGTQTSPNMAGKPNPSASQQPGANPQVPRQGRKPRRAPAKQYAMAARQRRIRQDYNNYHHPPSNEDVWICEFCEYESIFGSPPEALIRQYEIKDRRERRRLAKTRRLLEKAKMKGRKSKKGTKNTARSANSGTQTQHQTPKPRYDPKPMDHGAMHHQATQSEEYIPDIYDDDPLPMPVPLPQNPSKIPQPIAQIHGQSLRSANGSGALNTGCTNVGTVA